MDCQQKREKKKRIKVTDHIHNSDNGQHIESIDTGIAVYQKVEGPLVFGLAIKWWVV